MKALIIYFSQTGSTLKVAEQIRDGISEIADSCDFVELSDVEKTSIEGYDLVGLGCPVFYYQEPINVRDFIESLPELPDKHWFIFVTHGSVMGITLESLSEKLKQKGITVIGSHHTYADGTLPPYPYPTYTTGHPDEQDFEEARGFGADIVKRSKGVAAGDTSLIEELPPVTDKWTIKESEMITPEMLAKLMPALSVNKEKCVQCLKCEEACPVDGIEIAADPPKIQKPCVYCWYCAKICPETAIEADWRMMEQMVPASYKRYKVALDQAEARGEFRWLMDPDSIDFNNTLRKQREKKAKGK